MELGLRRQEKRGVVGESSFLEQCLVSHNLEDTGRVRIQLWMDLRPDVLLPNSHILHSPSGNIHAFGIAYEGGGNSSECTDKIKPLFFLCSPF